MFGTLNLIQKGLDASWMRGEVINNNIANVDTPNFKRSAVAFEEHFKAAMAGGDDGFHAKITREKHMDFGSGRRGSIDAEVVQDNTTTMRMDGNNVDIDKEMTDLARNTIYYQTLSRKASGEINQLRTAIKGQ